MIVEIKLTRVPATLAIADRTIIFTAIVAIIWKLALYARRIKSSAIAAFKWKQYSPAIKMMVRLVAIVVAIVAELLRTYSLEVGVIVAVS